MLTLEQGKLLIDIARNSIASYFSKSAYSPSTKIKKEFSELRGCFVTIYLGDRLRGCIGFPEPVYQLHDAIVRAASEAAFGDPRFPALSAKEFSQIRIEVSVLTPPRLLHVRNPEDYLKMIKIGRDGLIVRGTFHSGLLLPQVAVEYRWNAKQFLDQTCLKAGMKADTWLNFDECRVYRFHSEVFAESSPSGAVIKKL
ncbi:MAG: TIGR00296 family protein [Nanoarchaeota archaeon]|nr:TIGR00296 family protein [Nanoarchaeota archaeon]MBU1704910.1 TIGR00296 family protein [Nanoarchaeota archaeon]